jgi:hypothetical protein
VGRAAGVSRSPHRNSLAPRRGPQASWGSPAPARCQRQRPPAPATAASAAAAAALSASPAPRLVESTASRLFEKVADPPPPSNQYRRRGFSYCVLTKPCRAGGEVCRRFATAAQREPAENAAWFSSSLGSAGTKRPDHPPRAKGSAETAETSTYLFAAKDAAEGVFAGGTAADGEKRTGKRTPPGPPRSRTAEAQRLEAGRSGFAHTLNLEMTRKRDGYWRVSRLASAESI